MDARTGGLISLLFTLLIRFPFGLIIGGGNSRRLRFGIGSGELIVLNSACCWVAITGLKLDPCGASSCFVWEDSVTGSTVDCMSVSKVEEDRRLSPERGEEDSPQLISSSRMEAGEGGCSNPMDVSELDSIAGMVLGELASDSSADKEEDLSSSRANAEEVGCGTYSVAEEVDSVSPSVEEGVNSLTRSVIEEVESVSPSVLEEVDSLTGSMMEDVNSVSPSVVEEVDWASGWEVEEVDSASGSEVGEVEVASGSEVDLFDSASGAQVRDAARLTSDGAASIW